MPIIDVEIVLAPSEQAPAASSLVAGLAAALDAAEGGTWVRLRRLAAADYAEDSAPYPLPVFVTILKAVPGDREQLQREALAVAEVVGSACGRPREHTHVLYLPAATGRIAFGGRLLEDRSG